ncbi:hypothetical protein JNUCC0626_07175 [Lentzea sp. JNUCC 0626]|uniref:hypothetical protein n=1 Tax=Lentzea sp. JNUCC 0626 TaxID=3367513 RepID=UPI003748443E
MATKTAVLEAEVGMGNQHCYVEDVALREPIDALDFSDPTRWLLAMKNRLALMSEARRYHHASVRIEAWTAEPPAHDGWGSPQEVELRLDEGRVELWELGAGVATAGPVALGFRGDVRVRGYRRGGREVDAQPGIVRGVEMFLVRFWPADRG